MLTRLAVRVRRQDAELVLAELLDLAPEGLEERDLGDAVEYAVYGSPGELPSLPALRAAAGDALVEVTTEDIDDDWPERWRAFHEPIDVGAEGCRSRGEPQASRDGRRRRAPRPILHIRAPWHEPRPERLEVVIDPGQAFGTGAHPTTRLCLQLLLELDAGGALVDVGCGSGVLAIAAAKLGFGPVLGIDHERESVRATLDNAAANGVAVQARLHDLLHDGNPAGAPTVTANLLRPLLLRLAAEGFAGEPPRVVIAGGLLDHEADEVGAAFARRGLVEARRRASGGWAALLLRRDRAG